MSEVTLARALEAFRARVGLRTPTAVLEARVPCLDCGTLFRTEVLLASSSNLEPATIIEPLRRRCLNCQGRDSRERARETLRQGEENVGRERRASR